MFFELGRRFGSMWMLRGGIWTSGHGLTVEKVGDVWALQVHGMTVRARTIESLRHRYALLEANAIQAGIVMPEIKPYKAGLTITPNQDLYVDDVPEVLLDIPSEPRDASAIHRVRLTVGLHTEPGYLKTWLDCDGPGSTTDEEQNLDTLAMLIGQQLRSAGSFSYRIRG